MSAPLMATGNQYASRADNPVCYTHGEVHVYYMYDHNKNKRQQQQ